MSITELEATQMLGPLVALTNGWDDPKIDFWIDRLMKLNYADAAAAAIDMLANTWDQPGAPQWANFRKAYDSTSWRMYPTSNPMPELPPAEKNPRMDRVLRAYVAKVRTALGDDLRHNHLHGADGCRICSKHDGCAKGRCDRCRQLADLFTNALEETA